MPDPSLCVSSASCGISHLLYVYKFTIKQSTGKWQILEMHFTFKLSFANFLDTPPLFFSIINIRKRVTLSCSSKINSNFYFLKKLYIINMDDSHLSVKWRNLIWCLNYSTYLMVDMNFVAGHASETTYCCFWLHWEKECFPKTRISVVLLHWKHNAGKIILQNTWFQLNNCWMYR